MIAIIIVCILLMIAFYISGIRHGYDGAMEKVSKIRKHEGNKIAGRCFFCKYPLRKEEVSYGDYGKYMCEHCTEIEGRY